MTAPVRPYAGWKDLRRYLAPVEGPAEPAGPAAGSRSRCSSPTTRAARPPPSPRCCATCPRTGGCSPSTSPAG
ncbi:hypothetical protein AB6O49_28205 [Streptomyces sp. SBR177]